MTIRRGMYCCVLRLSSHLYFLTFSNFNFNIFRPPVRSSGRYSVLPVMFFLFFSTRNLRAPSADRRETLPHDRNLCQFYKFTPKIPGALPKKILGQKHAKLRSILYNLRLWSRISPNRLKISEIGKLIHRRQFLLRYMKKVRWTLVH